MTRALRLLPVLVLLLGTLLVAASCSREPPPATEPTAAPDFTLEDINGNRVSLSQHRGEVVLLDFWATWCPPCRVAIPHLVELQRKYRSQGLLVLGLNMDQDAEDVSEFLRQQPVNYPILKLDEPTRVAYGGVTSIPQVFVLDRTGKVRRKFLGFDPGVARDLEELVQKLLQESGASPVKPSSGG